MLPSAMKETSKIFNVHPGDGNLNLHRVCHSDFEFSENHVLSIVYANKGVKCSLIHSTQLAQTDWSAQQVLMVESTNGYPSPLN